MTPNPKTLSIAGATLPELVGLAYEAAADSAGLEGFVSRTRDYFASDGAAFIAWPRSRPDLFLADRQGMDDDLLDSLIDARDRPGSLFWQFNEDRPGTVYDDRRSRGSGWPDWPFLATLVDDDTDNNISVLLLTNHVSHRRFSAADQETLMTLGGFLRRATDVHRRTVILRADYKVARQVMDAAGRGVIVLGQQGQVIYANAAARDIFSRSDSIYLNGEQLSFRDDSARRQLDAFLKDIPQQQAAGKTGATGIRIERGKSTTPYQLLVYALPYDPYLAAMNKRQGCAIGMLHDPLMGYLPDTELLGVFFGLTPAEAQLAQALCKGLSVSQIAEQLSVSVHTVRTHLRNIFAKVGVHTQHALVQRISQSLHLDELSRPTTDPGNRGLPPVDTGP